MGVRNNELDSNFASKKRWSAEVSALRELVLETELEEERKWHQPVYTLNGKNVMIIGSFKNHCVLSFIKGVLLRDEHNLLVSPGEQSQSVRMLRITSVEQIHENSKAIRALVAEAIANEKAGRAVPRKTIEERDVPEEFQEKLDQLPELKKAFEALTPGRRRMYLMHFAGAKQASTRISRIEKCIPGIMEGKGLK